MFKNVLFRGKPSERSDKQDDEGFRWYEDPYMG